MFGTEVGGITPLIYRNDLLRAVIYPDSDDPADLSGNGADGTYDRVEYKYNRQAERIAMKDQNETVHSYTFDKLGRPLADEVVSFGTGVDQAVAKIARTYNVQGQVELITSYDGSSNVVNQVKQEYNAFGQLIADWQQHDGPVTGDSPRVGYTYTDATAGHTRLTALTYPNGRLLHFGYAAGTDDALNRVTWLADDNGSGSPGTHLAEYTYLGLTGIVQVDYAEPQIRYDLDHGTPGSYAGLDEFGRVKDLLWHNYGSSQDVVRIKHGYDRAGNRLWREDAVAAAQNPPVHLDELYTYDGVNRLVDAMRGDLNANKDSLVPGTKTFAEAWGLDSTGNWGSFNQDTTGGGWTLEQTRDHNPVNEITDIDETTGPSWVAPSHDRAGNLTEIPQPAAPTSTFDLTWDAWNRLVKVQDAQDTVAEYEHDGRNFRVLKKVYESGQLDHTQHFYHTIQWQVVEERLDASASDDRQYVWGLRYIDDLVLRDRDADGNSQTGNYGKAGSGLEARLYVLQDPNWNVAAVTDENGDAKERYLYAAYGTVTICNADWSATRGQSSHDQTSVYTGRERDPETGLYYYRQRHFSAGMGRFTSRDPIEGDANVYRYVRGNPIRGVDAYGLADQCDCLCCCVDSAAILNERRYEFWKHHEIWGIRGYWGHSFSHEASLLHLMEPGPKCKIQWFECSSTGTNYEGLHKVEPGEWLDILTDEKLMAVVETDWRDYLGCKQFVPPGEGLKLNWRDIPSVPYPQSREAKIAVRVSSGEGCPCSTPSVTIFLVQRLSTTAFYSPEVRPRPSEYQNETWQLEISYIAPPSKPGDRCDFAGIKW